MRTPPCLDEEVLGVPSARNIVFRGRKTSDEKKLLVSQVSVTQKIFGLEIRVVKVEAEVRGGGGGGGGGGWNTHMY